MALLRPILFLVLGCAPFLSFPAAAAPKWNTLETPHCLVVSQLSERDTRSWADQFEQFTAALRTTLCVDDKYLPPLTVVLFADGGRFGPYKPTGPNGKPRDIAGFFASRDTWGVIALADGFSDQATRHTVLHEATHWLVSATRTELPLWLNEGFAESFSTFRTEKDHAVIGEPLPYHIATLRRQNWLPLVQLLLTGANDPLYTDNKSNELYYAQAWLTTHQLLFENPKNGYEILNKFFAARVDGADQLTALEQACGRNLDSLGEHLESYARHGSFALLRLPLDPAGKVAAPFRPASPYTVEIALARVALTSGRPERTRAHLDQAIALDPAAPTAYELQAGLEMQLRNFEPATAAAQAALERGSGDAWMHFLAAQALWRRGADRQELPAQARAIADHLARAVALQPKLRDAYCAYARLAKALPSVTQADGNLLTAGYQRFPDCTELLVGLAVVLRKGNNPKEASRILELALSRGQQLTAEQRSEVEQLRADWEIEPLAQQVNDLAKQHKPREALAACDAILKIPMRGDRFRFWEARRNDLRYMAALDDARTAANTGNTAEAIRLVEALLAEPWLKQRQQNDARALLDILRRADQPEPKDES